MVAKQIEKIYRNYHLAIEKVNLNNNAKHKDKKILIKIIMIFKFKNYQK